MQHMAPSRHPKQIVDVILCYSGQGPRQRATHPYHKTLNYHLRFHPQLNYPQSPLCSCQHMCHTMLIIVPLHKLTFFLARASFTKFFVNCTHLAASPRQHYSCYHPSLHPCSAPVTHFSCLSYSHQNSCKIGATQIKPGPNSQDFLLVISDVVSVPWGMLSNGVKTPASCLPHTTSMTTVTESQGVGLR